MSGSFPTFNAQPGDEGFILVKAAIRDYLALDLAAYQLPPVVGADLPGGILDEGHFTEDTPTPALMLSTLGDGQSELSPVNTLARFLLYGIDRGRGLSRVERALHRARVRLNKPELTHEFFVFPPELGIRVEGIDARGSTASASLPAWKAEARAIYIFVTIRGLEAE